mmetsp:Transcript_27647/g.60868  ORF Transcript_27647/g.60868 Transcript_27647/m.60868 type:complete len:543 (+) Transcript_27647:122-1750(+)
MRSSPPRVVESSLRRSRLRSNAVPSGPWRVLVWVAVLSLAIAFLAQLLQRSWEAFQIKYQTFDFDLFVIGGGSGGIRAAMSSSKKYGVSVALAELPFGLVSGLPNRRVAGGVGGTCVIRGCIPKKLLVYASQEKHRGAEASAYGWFSGPTWHSWGRLMRHKNAVVKRLNRRFQGKLTASEVKIYEGQAKVQGPHLVEINGKTVTARYICVATGSAATIPDLPGIRLPGVVTSDEALVLRQRPRRLIVVGGGYIALEFAGFFRAFGTKVHLVVRKDLPLEGFDNDVRLHMTSMLEARGMKLHLRSEIICIERDLLGLMATTDQGENIYADTVLFATGRVPNSKNLGLAEVGVRLGTDGRILVNKYSQTTVQSIYAVGDVTGRLPLTPAAVREADALARTLFGGRPTQPMYDLAPRAIFSQPPVASCGLTEPQAARRYGSVDVYMSKFTPLKHSMPTRLEKEEQILVKLLVVSEGYFQSGRVVGVHMVGEDAPEIVQPLAIALKAGATKENFDETQAIHPTIAEEWCLLRTKNRTTLARQVKLS